MTMFVAVLRLPDDAGGTEPRRGPVAHRTNGTPSRGKVDATAVEQLEAASEQFRQSEGSEREVIERCLPLLRVFEANEDFDHLVDCYFLIGEAYYSLAEWESAEEFMSRAADLGFRYFPEEMSSYPLKVVGEAQYELGKGEEALATFRRRLHILRQENDVEELHGALFDVGGMLVNMEQFDDALVMLQEARRVAGMRRAELERMGAEDADDLLEGVKVDEGEILYHIAIAYYRQDKLDEAYTYLKRALRHFGQVGEEMRDQVSDRVVAVLDDLVQVAETLEDFESAELYRRQRDELNA